MYKTAIVILNYEAYHETERCIDSIINNKLNVVGIMVVDNASKNESVAYLKEKYRTVEKIRVIKSNKNLGFAKGNNLGIKWAKTIWNAEFVLLLNSDTFILEEDYLSKLLNGYQHGIGVIMSNVIKLNGRYVAPNYGTYNIIVLCLLIIKEIFSYYNIYFPLWLKKNDRNIIGPWIGGCDILLTPEYFKVFTGLYPLTFLYGEECILAIILRKARINCKIIDDAHILHAESKSTPIDLKEGTRKKQKMVIIGKLHMLFVRIIPFEFLRWIINYRK